jgi:hypothetical protein
MTLALIEDSERFIEQSSVRDSEHLIKSQDGRLLVTKQSSKEFNGIFISILRLIICFFFLFDTGK